MNFKWTFVRSLADSRLVKTSYIWLFIAPITAKMLSSMDTVINLTVFNEIVQISTRLPFSWQLLFFAACSFSVANIIYSVFCPDIYKHYRNYSEFTEQGRTLLEMHSAMKKMCIVGNGPSVRKKYQKILSGYFKHYCGWEGEVGDKIETPAMDQFDNIELSSKENVTNNAFYFVQTVANTHNWFAIALACLLYCVGLLLMLAIGIENICYVVSTIG
jgi:hypothetical protein